MQVPKSPRGYKSILVKCSARPVQWYLLSYTLQHNPIKMVWRKLKRIIAGRYFDKFEEMHKTIKNLIKSGGVATVKFGTC